MNFHFTAFVYCCPKHFLFTVQSQFSSSSTSNKNHISSQNCGFLRRNSFIFIFHSLSLQLFSGYDSSTFYTLHSNFSSFWGHNVETHRLSQYIYFFIEIYSPALSTAPFKKIIYFSVVLEDKKASLKTNLLLRMILRGLRRLLLFLMERVAWCSCVWLRDLRERRVWKVGLGWMKFVSDDLNKLEARGGPLLSITNLLYNCRKISTYVRNYDFQMWLELLSPID